MAFPTDSGLLEVVRYQLLKAAGIEFKQTLVRESRQIRRHAGGYTYAKQFKRLRRVLKRQRTVLGIELRETRRKLAQATALSPMRLARLNTFVERAQCIRAQQPKGARTFPGNPYVRRILSAQFEQTSILLEDVGRTPKHIVVDLGFRGIDEDNPGVEINHCGRFKSLTNPQRHWLNKRRAVEPAVGHLKADYRMDRCWLTGAAGNAAHAVLCAA